MQSLKNNIEFKCLSLIFGKAIPKKKKTFASFYPFFLAI